MAKSAAVQAAMSSTSAPAAAPAPAASSATNVAKVPGVAPPPEAVRGAPIVKEWEPAPGRFQTGDLPPDQQGGGTSGVDPAADGVVPAGATKVDGAPDLGEDGQPKVAEPAKEPPKTGAERRKDAFAALEKEQRLREVEGALKQEQTKASDAEARLLKAPISELLKLRGI